LRHRDNHQRDRRILPPVISRCTSPTSEKEPLAALTALAMIRHDTTRHDTESVEETFLAEASCVVANDAEDDP